MRFVVLDFLLFVFVFVWAIGTPLSCEVPECPLQPYGPGPVCTLRYLLPAFQNKGRSAYWLRWCLCFLCFLCFFTHLALPLTVFRRKPFFTSGAVG